jgi:DNA-3-methyladenine glycosylase I
VSEALAGPDGLLRCPWALSAEDYTEYQDREWGRAVHGEQALYERLCLEAFQSGLSWITILRRREGFRRAFAGFDPEAVARFDDGDVERLLGDAGIIRNRAKILAAVANSRAVLDLRDGPEGGLDPLIWSFAPAAGRSHRASARPSTLAEVPAVTPESTALAKELKRRGIRFVGPTTAYALMQACGLVDDHLADCHIRF